MSSVPSFYSIRRSASVEFLDLTAAEDVTKHVLEFVRDIISGKFLESWYNKHKYVFKVNLAKRGVKISFSALPGSWILSNMSLTRNLLCLRN
ncbi:unnamed protein product [Hymenolepis diminuta]|uniref:Uncharacterized protein n=1 Tax=Hymenolepis diminuta TaxID=6216 RepID=A0A564Y5S4_HYMDI|nr:unnamed protein product [Hymenolepis diminuta]